MPNYKKQFSKIYDKHIDKIYRFIFLKVSSQEIAEDLTSEVFIRTWDRFKSGEDIKNIQAFLYQIARNLVVDHYREKGKYQTISVDSVSILDPRPGVEKEAQVDSEMGQVRMALNNINQDYQELIILRYLEELSVAEIASILEKSEGAVRVSLHRALNNLREQLESQIREG
jgi:RNA polymerase sigma-70 factor, ECF subfamily